MSQPDPKDGVDKSDALAATMVEAPPAEGGQGIAISRGVAVGHFIVIETIGAGAMGTVVLAYDPALDRKVALKLLRPGVWTGPAATEGRQRLMREAQAMAKLSHPNVVTAYEVGTFREHVFLAMEYVEGRTLGKWLAAATRTWREVTDVFVQAGRGLAAAHAAGIVHRDFKPDNVLISADGRVRVGDFGLASVVGAQRVKPAAQAPGAGPQSPDGPSSMTHAGALIGTPAYMSPEQHKGEVADARADQFAFGVALFEALHGERPFAGSTYREYADNVIEGKRRAATSQARVPRWIERIVERTLAPEPSARFASMDEVLAALAADPAIQRRRIAMFAGGGLLVAVAAAAVIWRPSAEAPRLCQGADRSLDGVWDQVTRGAVEKAFRATGRPEAPATFGRVAKILDQRAGALVTMRSEACQATHVRGEQSPALLDLRMACLDRRTTELRVLVDLFAKAADETLVDNAVEAALGAARVESCADVAALTAAAPLPEDPAARAKIAALRERLARVESLAKGGKYKDAYALAAEVTAEAEKLAWPPLVGESLAQLALMEGRNGKPKDAEEHWRRVATLAAEAKDDVLLARAWLYLVHVVGYMQSRNDEAGVLEGIARVQAKRAGEPADLMGDLTNALGARQMSLGNYTEAAALFEEARKNRVAALGPDHPSVASAMANLAIAVEGTGDYARQRQLTEEVLRLREKILGPEHPTTAAALHSLGTALHNAREDEAALAAFRRSLKIREAVFGPDSLLVADSLSSVAIVLSEDNANLEEALALQLRALEIREKIFGKDHVQVTNSLSSLGGMYEEKGDLEEARRIRERVVELRTKAFGPDHVEVANALNSLAMTARRQKKYDEAEALYQRVLEIRLKHLGADHPEVGHALNNLGFLEVTRERWVDAERWYRKAVPILEAKLGMEHRRTLDTLVYFAGTLGELGKLEESIAAWERVIHGYTVGDSAGKMTDNDLAAVRFELARVLRRAKREPDRAAELARAARAGWVKLGGHDSDVASVDKWLAGKK